MTDGSAILNRIYHAHATALNLHQWSLAKLSCAKIAMKSQYRAEIVESRIELKFNYSNTLARLSDFELPVYNKILTPKWPQLNTNPG